MRIENKLAGWHEDFSLPGKEETTESGLRMIIHKEGNSEIPLPGQTVSVHYRGILEDGSQFDSSVDKGQPIRFPLGQGRVIKGWDEAIALMSKGEKRTLIIPPKLARDIALNVPKITAVTSNNICAISASMRRYSFYWIYV